MKSSKMSSCQSFGVEEIQARGVVMANRCRKEYISVNGRTLSGATSRLVPLCFQIAPCLVDDYQAPAHGYRSAQG